MFFGNLGLCYFSVKSVACMLTFLFLAVYFLSILCCIQPGTDFGILELILSASLNVALSRFGFPNFYSCLVLVACIFIDCIRYWQDPEREEHQLPVTVEASEPVSLQSHRIVASNGTEESQLSITETSDGTEENQLSTDSLAGEESIGNTNIGGGVSIGNTTIGGGRIDWKQINWRRRFDRKYNY